MTHVFSRAAFTALAAGYAVSASAADLENTVDVLDPIHVEDEWLTPAMSPINPQRLSTGRESAEALRDLLGVSGSRMGGHGTDISVRGQSQTRLNILLDGAYVHGGCPNRMDPPTAYASSGNYEEITVIRGVQTLEYGGGGTGGTILFERVTERFDDGEGPRIDLEAGYRGNSDTTDFAVDLAAGTPTVFARFIGSATDAGNYEDGDGNEVRSSYKEKGGSLILGYTPSTATRAEVTYEQQRTDDQLYPGAGMDSQYANNDLLRLKFDSREMGGPVTRLKVEAYGSAVEHEMDNYTLRPPPMRLFRAPSTSDTLGGRVVAHLASDVGRWKVGLDTQRNDRDTQRFQDNGPGAPSLNSWLWPGVEIDQTGLFAELTHDLSPVDRLTGGLRYDYVVSDADDTKVNTVPNAPGGPSGPLLSANDLYTTYYGTTASRVTDHNVGGLLRYEHDLDETAGTIYTSLSRGVRTPDASERFLASNSPMTNMRWVGNPDIKPEKHHQLEVGWLMRRPAIDADVSLFYNDVSDFVLRDRDLGDRASIYRNVDATLIGGEAQMSYRWSPTWTATAGVAYVRAENDTDDRPIAQTPPLEGLLGLEYSAARMIAGVQVQAAAKQTRVDTTSSTGIPGDGLDVRETPGWATLNLYGSYEITEAVSISAGVDNLFDKNYAYHLNRANAFDPVQVQVNEPGRSAWVKLSAWF